jgi:hypothetical protein
MDPKDCAARIVIVAPTCRPKTADLRPPVREHLRPPLLLRSIYLFSGLASRRDTGTNCNRERSGLVKEAKG